MNSNAIIAAALALCIFMSCANNSTINHNESSGTCGINSGAIIGWSDSLHSEEYLRTHPALPRVLCYFFENCSVWDAHDQESKFDFHAKNITTRFLLKIDSNGGISEAIQRDSGIPERPYIQLYKLLLDTKFQNPLYFKGKLEGKLTTDSLGRLKVLTFSKATLFDGTEDSTTISAQSDSIANIGKRRPEDILKEIRRNIPGFRYIYSSYAKSNPSVTGKITIKFAIIKNGEIASVKIVSSSTGCINMDRDLVGAVAKMKFNEIPFGDVWVTYAFILDK